MKMENFEVQEEPVWEPSEYNFRESTKRRRLEIESNSAETWHSCKRLYKRKTPILLMPTEILQKIFSFITYEELAKTVRLVNRRFRLIIQHALNLAFKNMETRLHSMQKVVYVSLEHAQGDMEIQCMCKILNVTEMLILHHSIIKSSIWRYIYNKYQPTNLCMYGGHILDLYNVTIRNFIGEPDKLYYPALAREYSLPPEVLLICQLSKMFALHFDRVCELPYNKSVFYSGSKMLDILDCASQAKRTVVQELHSGNNIFMKLHYHFRHAWFVALDINEDKQKSWPEEQRLMYMRLRRIVVSHTEMHLEYEQYKREDMLRPNRFSRLKKPINSVYTGYGEVGTTFFYYGVMNTGAYSVKFEPTRELYQIFENEEQLENNNNLSEVETQFTPFLGLEITVELKCPLALAPRKTIESINENSHADVLDKVQLKRTKGTFDLKMNFSCPSARYPRLPTFYHVSLKGRR